MPTQDRERENRSPILKKGENYNHFYGGVAQLGEHLPCKQGVMGSNPIISTTKWNKNHLTNHIGSELSRLERVPDKHEVGGSSPLGPTSERSSQN